MVIGLDNNLLFICKHRPHGHVPHGRVPHGRAPMITPMVQLPELGVQCGFVIGARGLNLELDNKLSRTDTLFQSVHSNLRAVQTFAYDQILWQCL